jgi:hypothetical protein
MCPLTNTSEKNGRRDHHSQAASISDNDNGASNVLRIVRNFNPPAVNTHKNHGGNHGTQIQPSLA